MEQIEDMDYELDWALHHLSKAREIAAALESEALAKPSAPQEVVAELREVQRAVEEACEELCYTVTEVVWLLTPGD